MLKKADMRIDTQKGRVSTGGSAPSPKILFENGMFWCNFTTQVYNSCGISSVHFKVTLDMWDNWHSSKDYGEMWDGKAKNWDIQPKV